MKAIFVLGLTPQGLSVIRTLGRAGHQVYAFGTNKRQVGYHSRYGKKYIFSSIEELKKIISKLLQTLQDRPICHITSGEILAMVLEHYKELYSLCDVISSPYSIVQKLAHKNQMYQLAEQKGFMVAPYQTLDQIKDINQLTFPIFIKRNYEIPLFFKAEKIHSAKELQTYINRIPEAQLQHILVQDYIEINKKDRIEISAQSFFSCGKLKGIFIGHQKRKLKTGLTACLIELKESSITKHIIKQCSSFMSELNYTGFAEFEFMYNKKNNLLFFTEVNTRACGTHSSFNKKYPNLLQALLQPYNCPNLVAHKKRIVWINLIRDIRARIQQKTLTGITDNFKASYDILSWDDPMPFFRQFI